MCSKTIKERNKAFRQLKKHHLLETLIHFKKKKSQAVVRKTIKMAKRNCWRQCCNTIGGETLLSDIWGVIRQMSVIRKSNIIPVLIKEN